jgi:hypothetical protein
VAGSQIPATIPKLSSFWLVVLLVSNAFRIDLRIDGQLPLVVNFEAVSLFVMSGTGFYNRQTLTRLPVIASYQ